MAVVCEGIWQSVQSHVSCDKLLSEGSQDDENEVRNWEKKNENEENRICCEGIKESKVLSPVINGTRIFKPDH